MGHQRRSSSGLDGICWLPRDSGRLVLRYWSCGCFGWLPNKKRKGVGASFDFQKHSGTNCLIDDTLTDVDSPEFSYLSHIRSSVVQGFNWACKEGPLTEDALRGVSFKLVGAALSPEPFLRGGGQIIPTTRRALYSSFLTASPRLLEPIYRLDVLCPPDCAQAVGAVVGRRRGHVVAQTPLGGTSLITLVAQVPVIDSFGLETDLRYVVLLQRERI